MPQSKPWAATQWRKHRSLGHHARPSIQSYHLLWRILKQLAPAPLYTPDYQKTAQAMPAMPVTQVQILKFSCIWVAKSWLTYMRSWLPFQEIQLPHPNIPY